MGGRDRGFRREPHAEVEWRRYLDSAFRHRRLVAGAITLGLAVGIAAALRLKPVYAARAHVWVDVPREADKNPGPTWSTELVVASAIDLLGSDVVLAEAVRSQRLYLRPKVGRDAAVFAGFGLKADYRAGTYRLQVDKTGRTFTLSSKGRFVPQTGAVGDSVGVGIGFVWLPPASELTPGRKVEFDVVPLYDATLAVLRQLEIRPGRDRSGNDRSSFIRIELRDPDPVVATAAVNAIAKRLVEVAADLKRQKLAALGAILADQLQHAESSVSHAEAALKSFRARTATLRLQRDSLPAGFLTNRVSQEQLRHDRDLIEQVLVAADSGGWIQALETIGSVQRSPDLVHALQDLTTKQAELRALRQRYTDAHPVVRRVAGEVATLERSTIPTLARALERDLATHERQLAMQVDSASEDLRRMSPLPVEEARLAREVTVAERAFMSLRERYDEARLAEVSVSPDVRLLDAAQEPDKPLYNLAPFALLLAVVGSAGLGVMGAVLLDHFDPKLRYPTQVNRELGLTILGVVPHVGRGNGNGPGSPAEVIEAVRGVRLNLLHAYGAAGPLLLTITSPGARDGKSFVSSNLALAFSHAGYRTLLIDGDIRRGTLHRLLRGARKPGLTELLAGEASPEAIVQATAYPGLAFVGCGARRNRGPELLGSDRMTRFLVGLRSNYDVLLVDSSPLAAGIDPYALGTVTGNLLLVVRSGATDRSFAETKLNVLEQLPIRLLGAVVNDVRPGSDYRNYSYYLVGYESDDEPADESAQQILGRP